MSAPSSVSDELDGGQRGGDVEDVEPADVADAEDARLERALARRERDAVAVAQMAEERRRRRPRRARGSRSRPRSESSSGEKSSSPIALMPGARGPAEADVALERGVEAGVEDHRRARRRGRGSATRPA